MVEVVKVNKPWRNYGPRLLKISTAAYLNRNMSGSFQTHSRSNTQWHDYQLNQQGTDTRKLLLLVVVEVAGDICVNEMGCVQIWFKVSPICVLPCTTFL